MLTTSTTMTLTYGSNAPGSYDSNDIGSDHMSAHSKDSFRSQSKLREILRDQSRREEQHIKQQSSNEASGSARSSTLMARANSTPSSITATGYQSFETAMAHTASVDRKRRPSLITSVSAAMVGSDANRSSSRKEIPFPSSKTSSNLDSLVTQMPPPRQRQHTASLTSLTSMQRQKSLRSPRGETEALPQVNEVSHARLARSRSSAASLTGGVDLKIVILGSQGVGKTSLVHRYTSGQFNTSSAPSTIGASFHTNKLTVDGIKIRLQIWDTAGQERFRSMAPMYYRGANAAIVVYDITNPSSFADVKSWIDELKQNVLSDLVIHVVGSKLDLADTSRQVSLIEAQTTVASWTQAHDTTGTSQASQTTDEVRQVPPSSFFFRIRKNSTTNTTPPSDSPPSPSPLARANTTSRLPSLSPLAAIAGSKLKAQDRAEMSIAPDVDHVSLPSSGSSNGNVAVNGHVSPPPQAWDAVEVTEVSAKDNRGIENVFVGIATRLVERREELEARDAAKKRSERESIFLSDEPRSAGYSTLHADDTQSTSAGAGWCCS